MITDVISPATIASTEAILAANPQFRRLPSDYAIALGGECRAVAEPKQYRHREA